MSAHADLSAGDRPGGPPGVPSAVPAASAGQVPGARSDGAARALASLPTDRLLRAAAWLRDPLVVVGAILLGAGAGAWIVDHLVLGRPVPLEAPVALIGAVVLAGRLGAKRAARQTAHLSVLQAASARMSRATTVEAVGRAVVEETGRIIDYHNARVYILEPPDQVVPIAFEGRVGAYDQVDLALLRTSLGQGFTGWVALHGEPLLIDDADADPRGANIPGTDDVDESMIVVPMRYDDRIVGVITLSKLGLRQFSRDDLRLLTILADQAATALETAHFLSRSHQLAAELQRLVDMSSSLSRSLDPRQVAELIARHLADATGADECAISLWDQANDRVVTLGYHPPQPPDLVADSFDLADFPATRATLESQEPVTILVDDPGADAAEVAYLRTQAFASLMMLPLVAKGRSIGLVELYATKPVRPNEASSALARTMANEAAMALDNANLYEQTRSLADHDPLTGFFNHRYFHQRLGEELLRAGRNRTSVSLLLLDLDRFKLVNDTFGHLLGDRVLAWTAELVRSSLRASDVAARYGGDEFAVILPETDAAAARIVAGRIVRTFQGRSFQAESRGAVPIGVSIGVATFPADAIAPTELISAADIALYRVKGAGGQAVASATPARRRRGTAHAGPAAHAATATRTTPTAHPGTTTG